MNISIKIPAVIGIVLTNDNKQVLVTKRRDAPIWVLPGGGLDNFEVPENGLIREVEEETGLKVHPYKLIGRYWPVNRLTSLTYVYACKILEGEPKISNETKEVKFVPLNELPHPFLPVHEDWIADFQANQSYPFDKPLSNVNYLSVVSYFAKHPIIVLRGLMAKLGLPINA